MTLKMGALTQNIYLFFLKENLQQGSFGIQRPLSHTNKARILICFVVLWTRLWSKYYMLIYYD